jgi:hypothetical protein
MIWAGLRVQTRLPEHQDPVPDKVGNVDLRVGEREEFGIPKSGEGSGRRDVAVRVHWKHEDRATLLPHEDLIADYQHAGRVDANTVTLAGALKLVTARST